MSWCSDDPEDEVISLFEGLLPNSDVPLSPQAIHGLKEEDTLGGILFLRLKDNHLRPKFRVLNSSNYVLL